MIYAGRKNIKMATIEDIEKRLKKIEDKIDEVLDLLAAYVAGEKIIE